MLNGASVVLPNMLVARLGAFNMMITSVGISFHFPHLAVNDAPGFIVFAVLYRFFSSACA
jgi:hypothetical protein